MARSLIGKEIPMYKPGGRWPANVTLDEQAAQLLDQMSGERKAGWTDADNRRSELGYRPDGYHRPANEVLSEHYGDTGGASRFFFVSRDEGTIETWNQDRANDAVLSTSPSNEHGDSAQNAVQTAFVQTEPETPSLFIAENPSESRQSAGSVTQLTPNSGDGSKPESMQPSMEGHGNHADNAATPSLTDTTTTTTSRCSSCGCAGHATSGDTLRSAEVGVVASSGSRLFYTAKASTAERCGSKHPTVKPLDLMCWLVRMVTPPGGTVLDPFAGSGTTLEAAITEGFRAIGIEQQAEYLADIENRLSVVAVRLPLDFGDPA